MQDPNLTNYVLEARAAQVSDEKITQELLAAGWSAEDIATALGGSGSQSPMSVAQPAQEVQPLPRGGDIFWEAWALYVYHFNSIVVLIAPVVVLMIFNGLLLPSLFQMGSVDLVTFWMLTIGGVVLSGLYGVLLGFGILLLLARRADSALHALTLALQNIGSYLWVAMLHTLVVVGSVVVASLAGGLAVGVIALAFQFVLTSALSDLRLAAIALQAVFFTAVFVFAVWLLIRLMFRYTFAAFVFVEEDARGVEALRRSAEYVGARFASILFRFWPILLLSFILSFVHIFLYFFVGPHEINSSLSPAMYPPLQSPELVLLSFVFQLAQIAVVMPLTLAFLRTLFISVRASAPQLTPAQKPRRGVVVGLAVSALAFPLVAGIIGSVILASLNSARSAGQDAVVRANLVMLKLGVEQYAVERGGLFPETLSEVPDLQAGRDLAAYEYRPSDDRKSFVLCAELRAAAEPVCVEGVVETPLDVAEEEVFLDEGVPLIDEEILDEGGM